MLSSKSLKTVDSIAHNWSQCNSTNVKTYQHQHQVTFGSDTEEPTRQRTQTRNSRIGLNRIFLLIFSVNSFYIRYLYQNQYPLKGVTVMLKLRMSRKMFVTKMALLLHACRTCRLAVAHGRPRSVKTYKNEIQIKFWSNFVIFNLQRQC